MRNALVLLLCSLVLVLSANTGPSGFFSQTDKEAVQEVLRTLPTNTITDAFHAVGTRKLFNLEQTKKEEFCKLAKAELSNEKATLGHIFHAVVVSEVLGCGETAPNKLVQRLEDESERDDLQSLCKVAAITSFLKSNNHVGQFKLETLSGVVSKIVELIDADGTARANSQAEEGTIFLGGIAFRALALLARILPEEKAQIESVFEYASTIFASAEEGDDTLEFVDADTQNSNLKTTATIVAGVTELSAALNLPVDIPKAKISLVAEYFLQHKVITTLEDALYLALGLTSVNSNSFMTPLVLTVTQRSLLSSNKGPDGFIKLKVTDVFGNYATDCKVFLIKAATADAKEILLVNQEVFPEATTAGNTEYSFNFLAAKPKQGDYSLEFKAVPTQAGRFITIDSVVRKVKVIGTVAVDTFSFVISDSFEDSEIMDTQKFAVEFGKTLEDVPRAYTGQYLRFNFRVKNSVSGRNVRVHQAFVKFSNQESGQEAIFVASPTERDYKLQVNLTAAREDKFNFISGRYKVEVLIGDAYIANPVDWHAANVFLQLGGESKKQTSHVLPEIIHQFRVPEQRPDPAISNAFTALCLAPFLILFLGLIRVRANIKRFPFSGVDFIYAVGFQACVGSILALIAIFWVRLTLMQTLIYLGVLGVPTLFFGQKALSNLAS